MTRARRDLRDRLFCAVLSSAGANKMLCVHETALPKLLKTAPGNDFRETIVANAD